MVPVKPTVYSMMISKNLSVSVQIFILYHKCVVQKGEIKRTCKHLSADLLFTFVENIDATLMPALQRCR